MRCVHPDVFSQSLFKPRDSFAILEEITISCRLRRLREWIRIAADEGYFNWLVKQRINYFVGLQCLVHILTGKGTLSTDLENLYIDLKLETCGRPCGMSP